MKYLIRTEGINTFKWLKANLQKKPKDNKRSPVTNEAKALSHLCVTDNGTTFVAATQYYMVVAKDIDVSCLPLIEGVDVDKGTPQKLPDGYYSLEIKGKEVILESTDLRGYPTAAIEKDNYGKEGINCQIFNGTLLDAMIAPFKLVKMQLSKGSFGSPMLFEFSEGVGFLDGKYYGLLMPILKEKVHYNAVIDALDGLKHVNIVEKERETDAKTE